MTFLGLLLAVLMGLTLGLFGGGGSVASTIEGPDRPLLYRNAH